jgi:hypothetical protein
MTERDKEDIPVFKSWRSWYVLVIGSLIGLIIFFYVFTKYFE